MRRVNEIDKMNYLHGDEIDRNLVAKVPFNLPKESMNIKGTNKRLEGVVNGNIICLDYEHDDGFRRKLTVLDERTFSPKNPKDIKVNSASFYYKDILYLDDEVDNLIYAYSTTQDRIVNKINFEEKNFISRFYFDHHSLLSYQIGETSTAPRYIGLLNLNTLIFKWNIRLPRIARIGVYDNYVYLLDNSNGLRKVNLEAGDLLWEKNFSDWDMEAYRPRDNYRFNVRDRIYIYKDLVLVNLELGLLLAINRHTGERAWIDENVTGKTFIVSQEGLVYSILGDKLNILSAETGQMVKQFTLADPDIQESLHSHYFVVTSIRLTTTHIWAVFFGAKSAASLLVAINPETGEIEWKKGFTPAVSGNPMFVNNRMYFCTVNLSIGAEDPRKDYIIEGEGGYIPG